MARLIKMANGHGGKREGAGRKKGSQTPQKVAVTPRNIISNVDPVDVILRGTQLFQSMAARYQPGTAENPNPNHDESKYIKYVMLMIDSAAKAAPYLRHRLASMVHTGQDGGAIKIEAINNAIANMSDKDLATLGRVLEPLAAAARVTPAVAGNPAGGNPTTQH